MSFERKYDPDPQGGQTMLNDVSNSPVLLRQVDINDIWGRFCWKLNDQAVPLHG